MSILFGHPSGNPNSFHTALSHLNAKKLEAFCVPWLPSEVCFQVLEALPIKNDLIQRLKRRNFAPLACAPVVQGRVGEWKRLVLRAVGFGTERLSYEANDWLMRTMLKECRRSSVTAVHSYEDCSLWQFQEAKQLGKACIYDLPIGFYRAWQEIEVQLRKKYGDWLKTERDTLNSHVRISQKMEEMNLADLVLVPSRFAEDTVKAFYPNKQVATVPYGVDLDFWGESVRRQRAAPLRFVCAGQLSVRKGTPLLIEAWKRAGIKDAELWLIGTWNLAADKFANLPAGVQWHAPCSSSRLREYYSDADVFILPSFFEGRALVIGEAMACGLAMVASDSTGVEDLVENDCGRLVPTGSLDALVEIMRWFANNRTKAAEMGQIARKKIQRSNWKGYRDSVTAAVAAIV